MQAECIFTKMDGNAFWDARAQYYKDFNEKNTLPPALTLANMLNIYDAEDIVEVACSSGLFTLFCLCNLEKAKNFISVDVSGAMIKLAEERKHNQTGINMEIAHKFVIGSATDLSFIKDESQDVYVSNMCIHMIMDKIRFLEEAKRVLKKGGKIGLTVPSEKDGLMDLFLTNLERIGCKPNFKENPWSTGYKDVMVKLLQNNGFRVIYCWQDHFKLPYHDDEDIDFQLSQGDAKNFFASLTPEKKAEYRKNIISDFASMKENFTPLQMKLISIVAVKEV